MRKINNSRETLEYYLILKIGEDSRKQSGQGCDITTFFFFLPFSENSWFVLNFASASTKLMGYCWGLGGYFISKQ